jgi:hypothetical protein
MLFGVYLVILRHLTLLGLGILKMTPEEVQIILIKF